MATLGEFWECSRLTDASYRTLLHLAPICYRSDAGVYCRNDPNWINSGNPDRPHLVSRAPFFITVGQSGNARYHPTRDYNVWFEMGDPTYYMSGVKRTFDFGTPARSTNLLRWQKSSANYYAWHGGHMLKWLLWIKTAQRPDNREIAWPITYNGCVRQGTEIYAGGQLVMKGRKFVAYDWPDPDGEPGSGGNELYHVPHRFENWDGVEHLILTLPDEMDAMANPVLDPSYTIQPAEAASRDTWVKEDSSTTVYDTDYLSIRTNAGYDRHALIKFDLSSIEGNITSAIFTGYAWNQVALGMTISIHAILVANTGWLEACSWDYADGAGASDRWAGDVGNNGGSDAGCSISGTDYNATSLGSFVMANNDPVGTSYPATLNATQMNAMKSANYGMIFVNGGATAKSLCSSQHTSVAYRPTLAIVSSIDLVNLNYGLFDDNVLFDSVVSGSPNTEGSSRRYWYE